MALDAAALAALSSLLEDNEESANNQEQETGNDTRVEPELNQVVFEALAAETGVDIGEIELGTGLEKDLHLSVLGRLAVLAQVEEETGAIGKDQTVLEADTVKELIEAFSGNPTD